MGVHSKSGDGEGRSKAGRKGPQAVTEAEFSPLLQVSMGNGSQLRYWILSPKCHPFEPILRCQAATPLAAAEALFDDLLSMYPLWSGTQPGLANGTFDDRAALLWAGYTYGGFPFVVWEPEPNTDEVTNHGQAWKHIPIRYRRWATRTWRMQETRRQEAIKAGSCPAGYRAPRMWAL